MAAPSTPILDDFSGTLGGWVQQAWEVGVGFPAAVFTISAGTVVGGAGLQNAMAWNSIFPSGDLEAYATISTLVAGGDAQIRIENNRGANYDSVDGHGYVLSVYESGNNYRIIRQSDDSTGTVIKSGNFTLASGDKFCLQRIGTTCSYWAFTSGAWSLVDSVVDATYTDSAYVGLFSFDNGMHFDDFGGGTPPDTTPPQVMLTMGMLGTGRY
jgi:hypothetical protein